MPAPLLVIDAPSLLYRAFFALPQSITDDDDRPVNALLGMANLVLFAVERHAPRAVVLCFGAEAAHYRKQLFEPYHADRPPMPEELERQWADAPAFFGAFGWQTLSDGALEADDLLGSLAKVEHAAGGDVLLFTGDRDMFQCVNDHVTVLFARGGKDGPEVVGPDEVRDRAAEWRLRRALGIDVDPLVVARDGREPVDVLLRDLVPVADAELLADLRAHLLEAVDREHGRQLRRQ